MEDRRIDLADDGGTVARRVGARERDERQAALVSRPSGAPASCETSASGTVAGS